MTCPQCKLEIPSKKLVSLSGLSRVVCPYCHTTLCPEPKRAILLFVVSFGLADAALLLLRRAHTGYLIALAGFFLVFAGVYALLAPLVVRLRVKESSGGSEPHWTGRSA
ncbi:MAG TPA: hypothetical protein VEG64_03260 [Candidatus Sulfotelmatobacter sp.]|nr:hypothetical protein [Candidatus Sulfotelmatobacter sp.]